MFIQGARSTDLPFDFNSLPISLPANSNNSSSHVAAMPNAAGKSVALPLLTPTGPSSIVNGGMPNLSLPSIYPVAPMPCTP